jgi:L-lactate permease
VALHSAETAMGNMMAIPNIVVVSSVLSLTWNEGEILRLTVGSMLNDGAIAAVDSMWLVI